MNELPKHELAFHDWKNGMKYKDIAEKYNSSINTVKSWKTRHWNTMSANNKSMHTKRKKVCTQNKVRKTKPNEQFNLDTLLLDAVEENTELTEQRKLFCVYYVKTFNATQSYLKAYGCSYNTANTDGPTLLVVPSVRAEIKRLKDIKKRTLLIDETDILEIHMRIAFADITDFVDFTAKAKPLLNDKRKPVYVNDPKTGEKKALAFIENEMKFKDSSLVDGQLISEISTGRNGGKIKLADAQKSRLFLEKYFEMHPADNYRREFEMKKIELQMMQMEMQLPPESENEEEDNSFYNALNVTAIEVWPDDKS